MVGLLLVMSSSVRRLVREAPTKVQRPSRDDVERISWGKPSKRKGVGSRGVPHRLNNDERLLYDMAKRKGWLEIEGSGWRSERREAPIVNTWRNWCDALARPSIVLHKPRTLCVDLSPLRHPAVFDELADLLEPHERRLPDDNEEDWNNEPIYRLEPRFLIWTFEDLGAAKKFSKELASMLDWPASSGSKKPNAKPGRSRRHGGYGI